MAQTFEGYRAELAKKMESRPPIQHTPTFSYVDLRLVVKPEYELSYVIWVYPNEKSF